MNQHVSCLLQKGAWDVARGALCQASPDTFSFQFVACVRGLPSNSRDMKDHGSRPMGPRTSPPTGTLGRLSHGLVSHGRTTRLGGTLTATRDGPPATT